MLCCCHTAVYNEGSQLQAVYRNMYKVPEYGSIRSSMLTAFTADFDKQHSTDIISKCRLS